MTTCVLVVGLASESIAQGIAPPDPSQLAPGFHVDVNGCVSGPNLGAGAPLPAPDNPGVRNEYQRDPGALAHYRAVYAEVQGDLLNAVALRRRELIHSPDDEDRKDSEIRLPLSIDLAHLGRLTAARQIWLGILKRRRGSYDSAVLEVRQHRYDVYLQKLNVDTTTINPEFQDSGAGAHLQRGISYANHRNFDRAAAEWRLAVRCSPDFQWPHFLLGIAAQLHGSPADARSEWLLTLDNSEPAPPDHPRYLDELQYDAMSLLVQR